MVEIKDIKNRGSLRAWLEGRRREDAVAIAHRAAMRVLPVYWRSVQKWPPARKAELGALSVLRANFNAGVVAYCSFSQVAAGLRAASLAADAASDSFEVAFANAADAASAAADAASSGSDFASDAAFATTFAASFATSEIWESARHDCKLLAQGNDLNCEPLWPNQENPLEDYWAELASNEEEGQFWIYWYDAALKGKPLKCELLKRIALALSKDWEKGPAHVNAIIAEIEGESELVEPEFEVTPAQMLNRNKSVIENQLGVLVQLVTEEINRIRGQNDFSKAEGERIAARVSVLESILAAVDKIRAALEGEEPSTALAVIDEQLPEVFEAAEKLEALRPEDVLSGSIIGIGVAVKYLTDSGMSSTVATTVAVGHMVTKKVAGLFGGKKKK